MAVKGSQKWNYALRSLTGDLFALRITRCVRSRSTTYVPYPLYSRGGRERLAPWQFDRLPFNLAVDDDNDDAREEEREREATVDFRSRLQAGLYEEFRKKVESLARIEWKKAYCSEKLMDPCLNWITLNSMQDALVFCSSFSDIELSRRVVREKIFLKIFISLIGSV